MIRRHPVVGSDIVGQIRYFNRVSHWIRHHHERPDGAGYPDSMALEAIPVEACIISVVDAYDAMVGGPAKEDKRPYREPMQPEAGQWQSFAVMPVHNFIRTWSRHSRGSLERERVLEENGEQVSGASALGGDSLWDAPLKHAGRPGNFLDDRRQHMNIVEHAVGWIAAGIVGSAIVNGFPVSAVACARRLPADIHCAGACGRVT